MAVSSQAPLVGPVAYDTALVARLTTPTGQPAFPESIEWLIRHQHRDGTWGSSHWYVYDRLINTLAAVSSLHHARRAPATVDRALLTIPTLLEACTTSEQYATVGFELLAPALLDSCQADGLTIAAAAAPTLYQERDRRLAAPLHPKSHFWAEALSTTVVGKLPLVPPSLPYWASPAATIRLVSRCYDPQRDGWIAPLLRYGQGGMPHIHPMDRFITTWMAWHSTLAGGVQHPIVRRLRERIWRWWTPQGLTFSTAFPIPDGDDTALAYRILADGGLCPPLGVLAPYMTKTGARCYPREHDRSISASIHMLLAVQAAPVSQQTAIWIDTLLQTLRQGRTQEGWLTDKWHTSPLYATSRAVIALASLDDALCTQLLDTILAHQHADGSWGVQGGTAEETAYAVLALTHGPSRDNCALRAGVAALEGLWSQSWPALWISKSLYLPRPIVASAIHAARRIGQSTQERIPVMYGVLRR